MSQQPIDSIQSKPWFGPLLAAAAGLAAAMLFVVAARGGSLAALLIGYFAPLPLMIVTLGFDLALAVGAVVVGAAFIALLFHPVVGLIFVLSLAAPALFVALAASRAPYAYSGDLVLLDDAASGGVASIDSKATDLAPTRAVLAAALAAAVTAIAAIVVTTWSFGGFDQAIAQLAAQVEPLLRQAFADAHALDAFKIEDVVRYAIYIAPFIMASSQMGMLLVNLWLGGRVALISGYMTRPWPSIADTLSIPPVLGAFFALFCVLVFRGGVVGVIAGVFAAVLGLAFMLQGLAFVHVVTRGSRMRGAILCTLYVVVLLLSPWPMFVLTLVGLLDATFHLRARASASSSAK